MDAADMHHFEGRVYNWSRWAKENRNGMRRCASMEGRYLPPAPDDVKLEFLRSNPVNVLDAEIVERGVCRLSACGRLLVVMFYVHRVPVTRISKRLKIDPAMFDGFRLRNLHDLSCQVMQLETVQLIRRGKPIWAGACIGRKSSV